MARPASEPDPRALPRGLYTTQGGIFDASMAPLGGPYDQNKNGPNNAGGGPGYGGNAGGGGGGGNSSGGGLGGGGPGGGGLGGSGPGRGGPRRGGPRRVGPGGGGGYFPGWPIGNNPYPGAPPPGPPYPPPGPAPYDYGYFLRPEEEWQVNHKINLSTLPSWNGGRQSIIEYLSQMGDLARLRDRMNESMAAVATRNWSGEGSSWWDTLPTMERIRDRMHEFEEMKFRQKGHESESPLNFLQRSTQYHHFLFPNDLDGPMAVDRVLRTQPPEWKCALNETACPTLLVLQNTASHMQDHLISTYTISKGLRQSSSYKKYPGFYFKKRQAHNAELEESEPEDLEETPKDAFASFSKFATKGKSKFRQGDFPEGRTINGYSFSRNDSVTAPRSPLLAVIYALALITSIVTALISESSKPCATPIRLLWI
ncbi:hypothetical protein CVT26_014514 [Gymnopilus dilepis]|uniref:Uncharacterized protein n=1 Tax=Gymnopilus dilepis TaxID=231916 RepID=A0A409W383_9AGAR|nr:hypothetical protein CVT26_014514 [Gymnopilus dilepis]